MEPEDRNFDAHQELKNPAMQFSEREENAFSLLEEALMEYAGGASKTGAKDQVTSLTNNIAQTEFKEAGLSDKQFGRKLYAKITTVFSYVLGNFLQKFVECNYPAGRFIEIQQSERRQAQKEIDFIVSQLPADRGVPKPKEYYTTLGQRAWRILEKKTKIESERRREALDAASFSPAPTSKKKIRPERVASETVEELLASWPELPDISESARAEFADRYEDMYMEETENYSERKRLLADIEDLKTQAEEEKDRCIVVNLIADGVRSAMVALTQKVKASLVPGYVGIQNKLTSTVVLEATGEFISNPLESSNLAGICQILKQEFHTANLSRFNKDFSELLRCPVQAEDLKKEPMRAARLTDRRIAEWIAIKS